MLKLSGKKEGEIISFLEIAVDMILEGKTIAFPTNSVYGLGGDPLNKGVVQKMYELKFRERGKGFLILVADFEEASKMAVFSEVGTKLANRFWPGQLTLILKKKNNCQIDSEVSGSETTIGLRVPENKIILKILKILKQRGHFGGLLGTSANYAGEPPSISGEHVAKTFLSPIDLIIDSGKTESKQATTIVDCTSENIKFLRIGKISKEEVLLALSE